MKILFGLFGLGVCLSVSVAASERWADVRNLEQQVKNGDYGSVSSILIMDQGDIIYEGYFGGAGKSSLHNTRSVTKTMTGMAVGAAVDEGLIQIDAPIAKLFSNEVSFQNPDPRKQGLTIEDLLTMSSVLECNDSDRFSRGNEARMHNVEDWASFFWDLPIKGYPSWSPKPSTAKYGRVFSYCSAGVEIAGMVVERATKHSFQEYFGAKFFQPMEITQFEWQENGLGQAHKSGGLSLTTLGLAKFAELHRNNGLYKGRQILSRDWVKEAIRPRVVAGLDSARMVGADGGAVRLGIKHGRHDKSFPCNHAGGKRT